MDFQHSTRVKLISVSISNAETMYITRVICVLYKHSHCFSFIISALTHNTSANTIFNWKPSLCFDFKGINSVIWVQNLGHLTELVCEWWSAVNRVCTCFHHGNRDVVPAGSFPVQDLSQSDGACYRIDVKDLVLVCALVYREPGNKAQIRV